MDLNECEKEGYILRRLPDPKRARSLLEIAKNKELTLNRLSIDEVSATTCVCIAYDSLHETLEAIACMKGFKVLNHICMGKLINSFDSQFPITLFDSLRHTRNGINYYGAPVDSTQANQIVQKTIDLRNSLLRSSLRF